jgi:hypothetical protein
VLGCHGVRRRSGPAPAGSSTGDHTHHHPILVDPRAELEGLGT